MAGSLGAFSLPGSTMLLFSLLALGKLAQVELVDLKVVGGGGVQQLSRREIRLLMGNVGCMSREEYGTWTTPVSGALWQLSQPSASAQPQGKKQFPYTSCPHT